MRFLRVLFLLILFTSLSAYELGTDSYASHTVFDPEKRAMGLIYPNSWLTPSDFLFQRNYEDSSYTYASWDQLFYINPQTGNMGFSGDIIARYIPYSFPHRWSVSLEWLHYLGASATDRNDIILHYRHKRGEIEYYRTDNNQTLKLQNADYNYAVKSQSLSFRYGLSRKFMLNGGMDFSLMEQEYTTLQHDVFHQMLQLIYVLNQKSNLYLAEESRYFWLDGNTKLMQVLRPGFRYQSPKFFSHLALRIAPGHLFPIAQIAFRPGPFSLEAYAKVRDPQFLLGQMANQYVGIKSSLNLTGKHHALKADAEVFYDFLPPSIETSPLVKHQYGGKAGMEYRFKTKSLDFYGSGKGYLTINPKPGFYHPEIATISLGMDLRSRPAGGKMSLDGKLQLQSIIHEDPSKVSFDPVKLIYQRNAAGAAVTDYMAKLQLKALVRSFSLTWDLSIPLKAGKDLTYYLYEGIYTSADFKYGNTFFTALSVEWYWWK